MQKFSKDPLKETINVRIMLKTYYKSVIKLSFTPSRVSWLDFFFAKTIMNFPGMKKHIQCNAIFNGNLTLFASCFVHERCFEFKSVC